MLNHDDSQEIVSENKKITPASAGRKGLKKINEQNKK